MPRVVQIHMLQAESCQPLQAADNLPEIQPSLEPQGDPELVVIAVSIKAHVLPFLPVELIGSHRLELLQV